MHLSLTGKGGTAKEAFPRATHLHLISEEAESSGQHKTRLPQPLLAPPNKQTRSVCSCKSSSVTHNPSPQRRNSALQGLLSRATRRHWRTQTLDTDHLSEEIRVECFTAAQPWPNKQGSSQGPSRLPTSVTDICASIVVLAHDSIGCARRRRHTCSLNPLGSTGAPHIDTHKYCSLSCTSTLIDQMELCRFVSA